MVHNENIAALLSESSTMQSGFSRYNKLLSALCLHGANIDLSSIKGMQNNPILEEAEDIQKIRNDIVHKGHKATISEMSEAKHIAYLMLTEVVEPVLNNLELVITSNQSRHSIAKA